MKSLKAVLLALTVIASASCASTISSSYTTDVRLKDGKAVRCAVNEATEAAEASGSPPAGTPPLTLRERNEAEVLATQPLRLLSGPFSPYPDPDTAPTLSCNEVPG
jgi:hypothetical protein